MDSCINKKEFKFNLVRSASGIKRPFISLIYIINNLPTLQTN